MRLEFLKLKSQASKLTSPHLVIYLKETYAPSRLAVVVPKKASKLATTRNWLKRLTYDTLWPAIKNSNLDCVIVFKSLSLAKSLSTKENLVKELTNINFIT